MTLFVNGVVAQKTIYDFEIGLGSYQMSDLKSIMTEGISANVLEPAVVTNFPPYLYFSPSVTYLEEFTRWGLNFTLFSTGARASIRDYSGEYRYDNVVVGFAPAIFLERPMYMNKKIATYFHVDLGAVYSTLNMEEYLKVYESELLNQTLDAMSWNVFAKPSLKVLYPINKHVNL